MHQYIFLDIAISNNLYPLEEISEQNAGKSKGTKGWHNFIWRWMP